mgnify:CR=1 FL=1
MFLWILGFVVAILWANVLEWSIHRFVLHDLGRKRDNFWRFHWSDHHSAARRNGFEDPDYAVTPFQWNAQGKEVVSLGFLFCLSLPFVWVSWGFVIGSWLSIANYYLLHRWAHLRPAWCRRWMPWHYDHHMAPNQDMNWCVTWPLMDHLMGTRLVWVGTEKEADQWQKILARKEDYRLRRDNPTSPSNAATNPKSRGVWC